MEPKLTQAIKAVDDVVAVQTSSGNWNYDRYMHGMANGMILCQAILKNTDPKFLSAPPKWISDREK